VHAHPATRDTISLEQAEILSHQAHAGGQYIMRLRAPAIAADARPGSFVHLRCDPTLPLRRPMSIMRADGQAGWIDILYKAHGLGTRLLAGRKEKETLSLLGPIGVPFKLNGYRRRPLLIGGGVGIPPMVFLAEHMTKEDKVIAPMAILGSEIPFPFRTRPSRLLIEGMPEGAVATMPLLEDWGIPCRLASLSGFAGCHEGYVTDLARVWLDQFSEAERQSVEIFACGPTPMLRAVAALAHEFDLPCQVSVEEFMACAVGGCAGCAVRVETEDGPAMKRVCVDGPVFEAAAVFPP
jgi:dihydroorotate dehydrogenase electron transfer subunit